MASKNNYINRAYNEVTRFVEKLPDGIAWDLVLTKVTAMKMMKKSDTAELLRRFREQGNVMVIDTKRAGEDVTYPVLKHKKYISNALDLTNTIGQVPNEPIPGLRTTFPPKRFTADDVTLKQTMIPQKPAGDVVTQKLVEDSTSYGDVKNKLGVLLTHSGLTKEQVSKMSDEELTETLLTVDVPSKLGLANDAQYEAAMAVLDTLKTHKAGLTRTQLNNLCFKYHQQGREGRTSILTALIKYAGVVDYRSPTSSDSRSATTLIHPDHVKNNVYSKLGDTNASEKAEKEKVITPAKPLTEVAAKGHVLNGYRKDRPMNSTDLYQIAHQLHGYIFNALSKPGVDAFELRDIHADFPDYSNLSYTEREAVSKVILSFGKLRTYRGEHTDGNIAYVTNETHNRFMGIAVHPAQQGNEIVYTTNGTKPLDKPVVTNRTTDIRVTKTSNEKEDFLPTDPVKAPAPAPAAVTFPAPLSVPGLDAAALQSMAAMLQQAAGLVENKQINDLLLEELMPLKTELNEKYNTLQQNVEAVLDSTVSLGLVIEKLNSLLK